MIDYDLYPTLSGNLGFGADKDLNSGKQSKNFNNSLNLSYELDIYGKLRDSASASEFSAKARCRFDNLYNSMQIHSSHFARLAHKKLKVAHK